MNTSQVSVSFKDMTVESTQEEGQKIGRTQRTLYREVMLEKYSHLVSMGYCYTKPEVILRLDQAEDPCLLEKEFLIRRSSEDCQHDNLVEKSQEIQDRRLWQVSFAPFQRTDTGGQSFNQESRLRVNQGNHADVTPFECGQNFSHNSTHTTEKFCDHNICRGTLRPQSPAAYECMSEDSHEVETL